MTHSGHRRHLIQDTATAALLFQKGVSERERMGWDEDGFNSERKEHDKRRMALRREEGFMDHFRRRRQMVKADTNTTSQTNSLTL